MLTSMYRVALKVMLCNNKHVTIDVNHVTIGDDSCDDRFYVMIDNGHMMISMR